MASIELNFVGCIEEDCDRRENSSRGTAKHVGGRRRTLLVFPDTVRQNKEVIPVNVSTWVLLSGVTVGR
jgi:hypothetical protein